VPWAEPGSQFTALFERLAIDLLREGSITGAVGLLRISGEEGWRIKARAVKRGRARRRAEVVARLGVDEKAIAKRHRYLTIVADLEQSRVLYLADDRKQETLRAIHADASAGSGRQHRVRQVPRRQASA
jgi:transposase